jgi:pimeloyl-ACP methyl ester carboxylesterase
MFANRSGTGQTLPRSRWLFVRAFCLLLALTAAALVPSSAAQAQESGPKPTVVLVHGAWADAAGWDGVAERLRSDGYPVVTPTNAMRTLSGDAQHIRDVLSGISGPIVLVAHSYGGAVITNAAAGNPNVKALVYVAAFAPDAGETVLGLLFSRPGSQLPLGLVPAPYVTDGIGVDTYLNSLLFRQVFCQDVSEETAAKMAVTQRPITLNVGLEPTAQSAWKTIPSWYLVAQDDRVIPPDVERYMAERAGSHTVEISSSHAAMVSNPGPVADLIRTAAATIQG